MGNLKSPQAIREIQFRFSKRDYLRPFAAPFASGRVFRRLGTLLWPTIFWHGAWHFTNIGDLAALNVKFTAFSHADELGKVTEAEYQGRLATLTKCPLAELPRTAQQGQFAHLMA